MNVELLDKTELSKMLKVSEKFIEKHTASRRIVGAIKLGRVWRYSRIEVEKRLLRGGEFLLRK